MTEDILDRLAKWASYKTGDIVPIDNWGDHLRHDIVDAIVEIKRLRSLTGAASDGMSLADIKRELGVKH